MFRELRREAVAVIIARLRSGIAARPISRSIVCAPADLSILCDAIEELEREHAEAEADALAVRVIEDACKREGYGGREVEPLASWIVRVARCAKAADAAEARLASAYDVLRVIEPLLYDAGYKHTVAEVRKQHPEAFDGE